MMDGIERGAPGKRIPVSPSKIFGILLLVLAFSSSSFAASCVQNTGEYIINGAGWAIGIAAVLTALVIAVAYMFGSVMSNSHAIVFAKDELYHLGFSLLLVAAASGIIASSCLITNYLFELVMPGTLAACGGANALISDLQACTMSKVLNAANVATEDFSQMSIVDMMYSAWFYTYAVPFSDVVTTVSSAFMKSYAMQLETLTNVYMIPVITSLQLQKLIVGMGVKYSIELILPAAFVFRLLPPFRPFGNFLIALAFGLYIIIPFFTIFNFSTYESMIGYCTTYRSILSDTVMDASGGLGYGSAGGMTFGYGSTCGTSHGFWQVASLIPQAFFLPNLTLALFITFLTGMNKALSVIG